MVDVNSHFCAAVDNVRDQNVCQTLERLKGIDVMEVPIVLADVHGMKIVAEQGLLGGEKVTAYGNDEFQEKFEGDKVVTYGEYKDARDFVSENRSNPQMTGTGVSQLSYMNDRIEHLDDKYMDKPDATPEPAVTPMEITH
jgi:hypothetical protein